MFNMDLSLCSHLVLN